MRCCTGRFSQKYIDWYVTSIHIDISALDSEQAKFEMTLDPLDENRANHVFAQKKHLSGVGLKLMETEIKRIAPEVGADSGGFFH